MQRKSGKQESGKDELTKPIQSTHPKMANLKTAYRSADGSTDGTSPEEDLRWDIPTPFDYISQIQIKQVTLLESTFMDITKGTSYRENEGERDAF